MKNFQLVPSEFDEVGVDGRTNVVGQLLLEVQPLFPALPVGKNQQRNSGQAQPHNHQIRLAIKMVYESLDS